MHRKCLYFILIQLFTATAEGQATTFSSCPLSIHPFRSEVGSMNSSPEIKDKKDKR